MTENSKLVSAEEAVKALEKRLENERELANSALQIQTQVHIHPFAAGEQYSQLVMGIRKFV